MDRDRAQGVALCHHACLYGIASRQVDYGSGGFGRSAVVLELRPICHLTRFVRPRQA